MVLQLRAGCQPMFPDPHQLRPVGPGLVALGGDLAPDTLIEAYGKGIFPWEAGPPIPWFSPDPRLILVPRAFRASRSLRQLARRPELRITLDAAFPQVIRACAGARRPGQVGTWITAPVIAAYEALSARGVAHSVEVWDDEGLAGGLYGLAMGRAFFGESMFARRSSCSKLALGHLCGALHRAGYRFVDCQQDTPHLRSLGGVTVPRLRYLRLLDEALGHADLWPSRVAATGSARPAL